MDDKELRRRLVELATVVTTHMMTNFELSPPQGETDEEESLLCKASADQAWAVARVLMQIAGSLLMDLGAFPESAGDPEIRRPAVQQWVTDSIQALMIKMHEVDRLEERAMSAKLERN